MMMVVMMMYVLLGRGTRSPLGRRVRGFEGGAAKSAEPV
jgi:hypothetical protein